ncbi:MAG: TolC family protein [Flavobacterium sp.]|nr:TolC family protein [Flavobacterium sp.]
MKNKVIILLLLLSFGVKAQQGQVLTLKEAISYALENKSDARKAQLSVENSEYQIDQVRSRALPQVTVNGNLTYNPILQLSAVPGEIAGQPGTTLLIPFGQKWNTVGGVSVTQAIFDQAVFTGLKAARTTREFYRINAELTDEQVIENVANNYYQVYIQRQRLTVLDSNYVNTSKVRDIIKGQFDNGLARKIDLDRINVLLSNLRTQRQQVLNAVQLQENTLKFFMGMAIDTPIVLPQTEFEIKPLPLTEDLDLSKRTELRLLETQEQLLKYNKQSIKAEYYPTLGLSGSFNYQATGNEFPLFAGSNQGVNWFDVASIGLNLRIPIFTGFSTRSRVQQADIELRSLSEDLKDARLGLELDYENARAQINNSLITINNQRENVQLAEEVLSNTRNNYLNGLATLTDLLDAENALIDSQNNYNTAVLEFKLAEIQLTKSRGELKTLLN